MNRTIGLGEDINLGVPFGVDSLDLTYTGFDGLEVQIEVRSYEPSVLHLDIHSQELDMDWEQKFYMDQRYWNREIEYMGREIKEIEDDQSFMGTIFYADGPLYEAPEGPSAEEIAYDEGFNTGYDEGYQSGFVEGGNGTGDGRPVIDVDEDVLNQAVSDFPDWVSEQRVASSIFSCSSDVRMDTPFSYAEGQLWTFWAAHDCTSYDMILTIVLNQYTIDNQFVGYTGADLTQKGCTNVYWFDDTVACEFRLEALGPNFAALFQGPFTPLFYIVEWERTSTFIPAFEWWGS